MKDSRDLLICTSGHIMKRLGTNTQTGKDSERERREERGYIFVRVGGVLLASEGRSGVKIPPEEKRVRIEKRIGIEEPALFTAEGEIPVRS